MAPLRASPSPPSNAVNTAYSLNLLSEYTHTLDSLPIDLSRNFADLRELDAVLSSSMTHLIERIHKLIQMIEQGTGLKEERLWLLTEISEEAQKLKHGDEDKIRVACQAADNLKSHTAYLRTLSDVIPEFDSSTLNRHTTYPHVAAKSYMPVMLETGRRRRTAYSSLLTTNVTDPSPAKRKRVLKDDEMDGRQPRKERVSEVVSRPRNGGRAKKVERAASPAESILSVTSHNFPSASHQGSSSRGPSHLGPIRTINGNGVNSISNKRARPSAFRPASPQPHEQNPSGPPYAPAHSTSNGQVPRNYHLPPSSSHPSLPLPFHNATNGYGHQIPPPPLANGTWNNNPRQLEGPGMPARTTTTGYAAEMAPIPTIADGFVDLNNDAGDGDGDDRIWCFCGRAENGEMIGCDSKICDTEWFHLNCIGLTVIPTGSWICDTCKAKKAGNKRNGRGGKRRTNGNRGGRTASGA